MSRSPCPRGRSYVPVSPHLSPAPAPDSPPRRHRRSRSRETRQFYERQQVPFHQRQAPDPSNVLGVFGMNKRTTKEDLRAIFEQYGHLTKVHLITEKDTGHSKGFGFVYFESTDDAVAAKEACHGQEIHGCPIRIDFSVTKNPNQKTPGVYLGRRSSRGGNFRRRSRSRSADRYRRRSVSPPHHRSRRGRSRSRSRDRYDRVRYVEHEPRHRHSHHRGGSPARDVYYARQEGSSRPRRSLSPPYRRR